MWLKDVICINYKSLRKVHAVFARDSANVIIGINDCGKSTLLHALGLLFNSNKFKFNFSSEFQARTDFSNSPVPQNEYEDLLASLEIPLLPYNESQSIILGKLMVEDLDRTPEAMENYSAILKWTIERSGQDHLWLASLSQTADGTTQSHILSRDILENGVPLQLLNETLANLQNRVEAKGLRAAKADPSRRGGFTKDELIEAICNGQELSAIWLTYEKQPFRKDSEAIYPEYQYLDWNISFAELENVAKVAVQDRIEDQITNTKQHAETMAAEAQEVVNVELENFRVALADALPNIEAIKATVMFKVDSKITDIFLNKSNTDGDIYLDSQGEGIKRQIWFALLKWKAMQGRVGNNTRKKYIWCFDEPETHLYPKAQREFYEILKKIAGEEFQILICTHSTVFIDRARFQDIRKFSLSDSYTCVSTCENVAGVYDALDIRNSDFLFYDKFLVVEGDTEEVLMPHMFQIVTGGTLVESGIQLVKLGGKNKRSDHATIFENMLRGFNKSSENVVYLLDNDVRGEMSPAEIEKFCKYNVGRQDLEDSIPVDVWHKIVRVHFDNGVITDDEINDIYNGILADAKLNSNQKFYSALKSKLKSNIGEENRHIVDDNLPEKGRELGSLLKTYVIEKTHVSDGITAAFAELIEE